MRRGGGGLVDWRSGENWLFLGPFFAVVLAFLAVVGWLVYSALTGGVCS